MTVTSPQDRARPRSQRGRPPGDPAIANDLAATSSPATPVAGATAAER